jgi:two-component sensor histidine kinase
MAEQQRPMLKHIAALKGRARSGKGTQGRNLFKHGVGMGDWVPITKSALITAAVGGLLSGFVLVRAGLPAAAIPGCILGYLSTAIFVSYLLHPSTAKLARVTAYSRAMVARLRAERGYLKFLSALFFTIAVILTHVFVNVDPRNMAYISLAAPVIISFMLFGFEYGLFSLILTCASCFYFFIPPLFNFDFYEWKDVELVGHFVAFSVLCTWVLKFIVAKSLPLDALALETFVSYPLLRSVSSFASGNATDNRSVERMTARRKIGEFESELAACQQQLADAETRYRELRHRIKNDFQAFYFLAVSEAQNSGSPEEFLRWVVRLRSAGELYSVLDNKDSDLISMTDYLAALTDALDKMFDGRSMIEATVEADIFFDPKSAKFVGLIYAEAAMNALKHAFPGNIDGRLQMRFVRNGDVFEMTVSDDGVGFDPAATRRGLGLNLMHNLAGQLAGTVRLEPGPIGSVLRLTFSAINQVGAVSERRGAWPDFVAALKAIWCRA